MVVYIGRTASVPKIEWKTNGRTANGQTDRLALTELRFYVSLDRKKLGLAYFGAIIPHNSSGLILMPNETKPKTKG